MRDTGIKSLFALIGVLIGHENSSTPLAAKPEPLAQAQGLQQDGRGNSDGRIGRHKPYAHSGNAHDKHGEDKHALTAQLVAVMPKDESAQRARQIADGKGAVRQDGSHEGIGGGEIEFAENDARHDPIKEKVVPLDGGAEQTGNNHLAHFFFAGGMSIHFCVGHAPSTAAQGYLPCRTTTKSFNRLYNYQ